MSPPDVEYQIIFKPFRLRSPYFLHVLINIWGIKCWKVLHEFQSLYNTATCWKSVWRFLLLWLYIYFSLWLIHTLKNIISLGRDLQTFLSEGHINYYTTVRGPDILRNMIVSGYVAFYKINKCFVNISSFIIDKMASRAVVWRPLS